LKVEVWGKEVHGLHRGTIEQLFSCGGANPEKKKKKLKKKKKE